MWGKQFIFSPCTSKCHGTSKWRNSSEIIFLNDAKIETDTSIMFVFMLGKTNCFQDLWQMLQALEDASSRIMWFTDCVCGWGKSLWQRSIRHLWSYKCHRSHKTILDRLIIIHYDTLSGCSTLHSRVVHVINIKIANSLMGVLKMSKVSETFACTIIAMLMMLKFPNCLDLITQCTFPWDDNEKFFILFKNLNFELFQLITGKGK